MLVDVSLEYDDVTRVMASERSACSSFFRSLSGGGLLNEVKDRTVKLTAMSGNCSKRSWRSSAGS